VLEKIMSLEPLMELLFPSKPQNVIHAITLQAVCDPKLKFTDCFVGYPGSVIQEFLEIPIYIIA
jgi:hypothetical protein